MTDVDRWDDLGHRFGKRVVKLGRASDYTITDEGVVLGVAEGSADLTVPWLDVLDALSDDTW